MFSNSDFRKYRDAIEFSDPNLDDSRSSVSQKSELPPPTPGMCGIFKPNRWDVFSEDVQIAFGEVIHPQRPSHGK